LILLVVLLSSPRASSGAWWCAAYEPRLAYLGFVVLVAAVVIAPLLSSNYRTFQLAFVGIYLIALLRAEHPHRAHRPDLARSRRVHGHRGVHDDDPRCSTTAGTTS